MYTIIFILYVIQLNKNYFKKITYNLACDVGRVLQHRIVLTIMDILGDNPSLENDLHETMKKNHICHPLNKMEKTKKMTVRF